MTENWGTAMQFWVRAFVGSILFMPVALWQSTRGLGEYGTVWTMLIGVFIVAVVFGYRSK